MLVKTKSQMNKLFSAFDISTSTSPSPDKENQYQWWLYSCDKLVWNDPRLLIICVKSDICATCRLCVISSVYSNCWKWQSFSETLLTDVLESFWQFENLMVAFTTGWICTNKRLLYIVLFQHKLNSLKFLTKFHHCYQKKKKRIIFLVH